MKIALLSDIHSNIMALQMALDSLKNEKIDKYIFLGDYITDGENENEILSKVKEKADYAILGNREGYILEYYPLRKDFNNYKTIDTTYKNLSKESLNYIKNLKEYYLININNYKILIIHGNQYFKDTTNMEQGFDKIIDDFSFDICLFGHTHKYLYKEYKNKIFINPGSIGQPCDYPTYKYCILEIDNDINVHLKEFSVEESFNKLLSSYKKTKYYKDNYVWSTLILYIIKDGIDYCALFLEMFSDKVKNKDNLKAKEFNKIWDQTFIEFRKKYNLDEL